MEKLRNIVQFQQIQNIVLEGFDPISAGGFTQVPNFILKNADLSSNAKVAYSLLLSYAWTNNRVFPGQERMAEDMGTSQPTVTRAIAELERVGYLEIIRRGQGLTNLYTLHHTVKQKVKSEAVIHR
jgi:DNA-binding MarR family transcriptional regulator